MLKWAHLADKHAPVGTTDPVTPDLYLARIAFMSDSKADVLTSRRHALAQAREIGDPTTLLDASARGAQFRWSPRHHTEQSEACPQGDGLAGRAPQERRARSTIG